MILTGTILAANPVPLPLCPPACPTWTGPLVYVTTEHRIVAEINDDFNTEASLKESSQT